MKKLNRPPAQEIVRNAKRELTDQMNTESPDSESIIQLLTSLREEVELSVDDTGWSFWNICDRYACMRDAESQYKYHLEFHEWSKANLSPLRLHWVVSDGTQALTLVRGGFLKFWWQCYLLANDQCPPVAENRNVRFESHRSAAGAFTIIGDFNRTEAALSAIQQLLSEDQEWCNRDFADITSRTLLVDYYRESGQNDMLAEAGEALLEKLYSWFDRVGGDVEATSPKPPLFGSWAGINAERAPSSVFVGIHNAACAYTNAKRFSISEQLFDILWERKRYVTAYGESQYLLSCWENRHSKDEILGSLSRSQKLTPTVLEKFVPGLMDIVGSGHGS